MPQNTNLNVTPYYDDFDKDKNFYKVLFRPGFPIQARELTSMQSILQNQVENMGTNLFKDGAMIIPGQVGYDTKVDCIQLQASFLGADVESYRNQLTGKLITGLNTGVKAKVLYSIDATTSDNGYLTLYIKYVESGGTEGTIQTFENNEQLITDVDITFGTTLIETGSPFAQLLPSNALQRGSTAYIESGVYYIRGYFVDVPKQYILLDQYGSNPSYRIGLEVTESIITSEDDDSLNDNAAGTSNYSAPGAHRFKITTTLTKKLIDDESDKNFIELLRINNSRVEKIVQRTAYNELEKALAKRTYDTHGDYSVKNHQITIRDCLNDDLRPGINGVYDPGETTKSGNVASDDLYTAEITPGIDYVRGNQIETLVPQFVDFKKPRDTVALENQIIPFATGNNFQANKVHGFPNFTGAGSVGSAYQVMELYDVAISTSGQAPSGNIVGYARTLAMEHEGTGTDTTYGTDDDVYNVNVFDVQMLTVIQVDASTDILQGSIVKGGTSGATALVLEDQTGATHLKTYGLRGRFRTGETLFIDGIDKGTIQYFYSYEFSDARSFVCRDETNTATIECTANVILDDYLALEGDTFTYNSGAGTITGFNSNFARDLRAGDRLYIDENNYLVVDSVDPTNFTSSGAGTTIFDFNNQVVNVAAGAGTVAAETYTVMVRNRAQLLGQQDNDLFSEMPKKYIKSISDESMIVRRTYDAISVPSGTFVTTLGTNEQFVAIDDEEYQLTVLGATSGNESLIGTHISLNDVGAGGSVSGASPAGDAQITNGITLTVATGTNVTSVKLTATVSKNVVQKKIKTLRKMAVNKIHRTTENKDTPLFGLSYSHLYGIRIQDDEISLGVSDTYQLHAVYESIDSNDPIVPSLTIAEPTFFEPGTIITGKTSSAKGKVVAFTTSTLKVNFIAISGTFLAGETISGFDANGQIITALINDDENAIILGSKVVTEDYYLDQNQKGYFYDTSKIVRKPGRPAPIRKLLVIYDYMLHAATGDYFAGESYSGIDYYDIPFYAQRQSLTDVLDFRPSAEPRWSTGLGTIASPATLDCSTLDFKSRLFTSNGGATIVDIPKIGSNFRCDYDFYLPKINKIFLTPEGEFKIVEGKSAERPEEPDSLDNAMHLATMRLRPYGFDPENDVFLTKEDNRRYTMRDIGTLDRRISNVEYYTSLSLLEGDAVNTKILDANGKDRLKNGFLVDDFTSHDKSDTSHPDYLASLDFAAGVARPAHYTTNVSLEWNQTASANVQKTGQLVTLPYEEELIIEQPFASRVVNVNPFNVFTFIGRIDLLPASDDWVDTIREPANIRTIEGNFESTRKEMGADQNGFLPIQWNAWRTTWQGDGEVLRTETFRNSGWLAEDVGRSPRPWVWGGKGLRRVNERTIIETQETQERTGIRTQVVPRIDHESLGDSILSSTAIPWIRSRNVKMDVARLKPRTRFYSFFDSRAFTNYITPKLIELVKDSTLDTRSNDTPFQIGETVIGQTSGCRPKVAAPNDDMQWNPYDDTEMPSTYGSTTAFLNIDTEAMAAQVSGDFFGNIAVGEVLVGESGARAVIKDRRLFSDRSGNFKAAFFIPNPDVDTNPRWGTGTRSIRLTTSDVDSRIVGSVSSSAETTYTATGVLQTVQENILAVRNAEVVRDTVSEERTIMGTREEVRQIGWYDPLAQSFIIDKPGGCFVTSFEVFFFTKDERVPISCQIRAMENGYPTKRILPFSDITLNPDQVQLSDNASIPTKFTFQSPVYLQQSVEYCFVLLSDSNEYEIWVSRMGGEDVTGNRTISEQPYAGVLFKSQNASTWTAEQMEDLKFTCYLAKFNNGQQSKMILNNSTLSQGNSGVLHLGNNSIQTFKPDQELVLNAANVPFTIGSRVQQITGSGSTTGYQAVGTVKSVTEKAAGTAVTISDITGSFLANEEITTSKTVATFTVASVSTSDSTNFAVGNYIRNGTNSTGEITAATITGTAGTITVKFASIGTNNAGFANGESIGVYSAINGTSSLDTATINVTPTYSGDMTSGGALTRAFPAAAVVYTSDQKRIKVYHSNHCMHDARNNVIISGVRSEIEPTTLSNSIGSDDTTLTVADASAFHKFINGQQISTTNPGYIKVLAERATGLAAADENGDFADSSSFVTEEVMAYSAISADGTEITLLTSGGREVEGTASAFSEGAIVECYNLDGVPLNRINKTHTAIQNPTLNSYELALDVVATNGIIAGGRRATATQNVQFDLISPSIAKLQLPGTTIEARVKAITGSSIGNGQAPLDQESFVDNGQFDDILLDQNNYFSSPRMIASQINEQNELSGNKSLRLELTMDSENEYLTPYVDLDRLSLVTTMNKINSPDSTDGMLLATGDDHEAIYITKVATLNQKSGSIKLIFTANRYDGTLIYPLYRVRPVGSTDNIEETQFTMFPTENSSVPGTTVNERYYEYSYEVDGLKFDQFQIKIVMVSPNQSYVPSIKDLRAIALAV